MWDWQRLESEKKDLLFLEIFNSIITCWFAEEFKNQWQRLANEYLRSTCDFTKSEILKEIQSHISVSFTFSLWLCLFVCLISVHSFFRHTLDNFIDTILDRLKTSCHISKKNLLALKNNMDGINYSMFVSTISSLSISEGICFFSFLETWSRTSEEILGEKNRCCFIDKQWKVQSFLRCSPM